MNDPARGSGPPDPVERALDELARSYAGARPSPAVAERIAARVALTPQRRRRVLHLGPWPLRRSLTRTGRAARVLWTALVAVAAVTVVAVGIASVMGRPVRPAPNGVPPIGSGSVGPGAPTPTAAASQATAGPGAIGTCPVTAITRVVGGTAPEVDASGLRWRWGGVPWVAGAPEKVVWLPDDGSVPDADLYLFGTRLDRSIEHGGVGVTYPGAGNRRILATGAGVSGVEDVVVPQPGCWLLTATWPGGASSVVVAVAPASPASGGSSSPPSTLEVTAAPLAACPASKRSADATAQGWPGPGYVDGDFRWLTPTAASWIIGGHGDKLVLDSGAGWDIGHMAIEAVPLLRPSGLGWLGRPAVEGDIPPGFGGGTLGVGLTLPGRGCWAIAYAGSQATSTIVVDLGG